MPNYQSKIRKIFFIVLLLAFVMPSYASGWRRLTRTPRTRASINFPKSPTPIQSFYPTIRNNMTTNSQHTARRNWVDLGNGTRIHFGKNPMPKGEQRIDPDVLKTLQRLKNRPKRPLYQLKSETDNSAPITGAKSNVLQSSKAEEDERKEIGTSKLKLTLPPGKNIKIEAMDFRDTDVAVAIRNLAQLININLMLSPGITGKVNILFSDITIEEALNTLLNSYNLSFAWEGNILRIFPAASAPQQTKLFTLQNTNPVDIKPIIDKMLTPKGKSEIDKRTNSLLITDTSAKLNEIKNLLPQIDIKETSVDVSSRPVTEVFYLDYADAVNLEPAIKMLSAGAEIQAFSSSQASQAGAAGGGSKGGRLDMMIIKDTQNNLDRIRELIEKLDIPPVQVTIDARIYEINLNKEKRMGINWQKQIPLPGTGQNIFKATIAPEDANAGGTGVFRFGSLDVNQFTALLSMLSSHDFAKVLSNPVITTLNNRQANITVGQAIPYISASQVNAQTGQVTNTVAQANANIALVVTPSVTGNDEVFMDIQPTISSVLGFTTLGGNSTPNISNRSAQTQVICKDNHTIVIGGMIKTDKSTSVAKVPFFGDLPGIGKLFQKTTEKEIRTELIIFITPHIVRRQANRFRRVSANNPNIAPRLTLQP